MYLHNPVGIGEHPDLVSAVDEQIDNMAHAEDKLEVLNKYYVLKEKWASTKKSPRRWREGVISYFLGHEGVTRNENGREDMTEKKGVKGTWPGKIGGDGVIAKKIWRNGVSV